VTEKSDDLGNTFGSSLTAFLLTILRNAYVGPSCDEVDLDQRIAPDRTKAFASRDFARLFTPAAGAAGMTATRQMPRVVIRVMPY
jgi:hypothetical protein